MARAMLELQKVASPLGAGMTFAGIGGLVQGYRGYSQAKDQGMGTGDALRAAGKGALQGAAIGGVAGAGLHAVSPTAGTWVSNLGKRQVHGLTGWTPAGGIRSIGGGAHDAAEGLHAANQAMHEMTHFDNALKGQAHNLDPSRLQELRSMAPEELAKHRANVGDRLTNASKAYTAAERSERMGLTSLPGVFRSVKDNGLFPTMAAGAAEQWHSGSNVDRALSFGLPAVGLVSAIRGVNPPEAGVGKGEAVGDQVGQLAGGIIGTPLPFTAQMLLQEGAGRVGKGVGRMVDRIRGTAPQETTLCSPYKHS